MSQQKPNVVIMGAPNQGKAQPLHASIKSPTNDNLTFRTAEVGDSIYGEDGRVHKILQIHEQGNLDCYKVTFTDGSSTECNDEHLWDFTLDNDHKTMTLAEIMEDEHIKNNAEFPLTKAVVTLRATLPIDPRVLGILLRDNSKTVVRADGSIVLYRHNASDEDIIIDTLPDVVISNIVDSRNIEINSETLTIALKNLNIQFNPSSGSVAKFKTIPSMYFLSSVKQRTELLTALCPTSTKFSTTSPALHKAVCLLGESLGYRAVRKTYTNNDGVSTYAISFDTNLRKIASIEYMYISPMRCISTSNPTCLYLTDSYIVTHNTYSMRSLAHDAQSAKKVLYIGADNKSLPWFGTNEFTNYTLLCPTMLPNVIDQAGKAVDEKGNPRFDVIIVDTLTRVMETYASRYISSTTPKYVYNANNELLTDMNYVATTKSGTIDSLQAWGRSSSLFRDIMGAADTANAQVIFLSHMTLTQRPDGTYTYEAPLQGAVGKTGLSAWFSISIVARSVPCSELDSEPDTYMLDKKESRKGTGHKYVFQIEKTANTAEYPIRCIDGMFPETMHYINNDFKLLIQHLDNLYSGVETNLPF